MMKCRMQRGYDMGLHDFLCKAFCAVAVSFAVIVVGEDDTHLPKELVPAARMDFRSADPSRAIGIFGDYWWANRFLERHQLIERIRGRQVDLVLIGDSIVQRWEGGHPISWAEFTQGHTVVNLGYGSDGTQNVLWRILHGELDGYEAKSVAILIGVNNTAKEGCEPANVAAAIQKIVDVVRERQPKAMIILNAIFPVGDSPASKLAVCRRRNDETNRLLKSFVDADGQIAWIDCGARFLDGSGWVPRTVMPDEVHPTDAAYAIWADALRAELGWKRAPCLKKP